MTEGARNRYKDPLPYLEETVIGENHELELVYVPSVLYSGVYIDRAEDPRTLRIYPRFFVGERLDVLFSVEKYGELLQARTQTLHPAFEYAIEDEDIKFVPVKFNGNIDFYMYIPIGVEVYKE